jgi:hypothetical protein
VFNGDFIPREYSRVVASAILIFAIISTHGGIFGLVVAVSSPEFPFLLHPVSHRRLFVAITYYSSIQNFSRQNR